MGLFDDLENSAENAPAGRAIQTRTKSTGKKTQKKGTSVLKRKNYGKKAGEKTASVRNGRNAAVVSASMMQGEVDFIRPESIDQVRELLPRWAAAWCERQGVESLRGCSPLIYDAFCKDVGRVLIKPSKLMHRREIGEPYSPEAVAQLYEIFVHFCGLCDQIPFQSSFASFAGVKACEASLDASITALRRFAGKSSRIELDAVRKRTSCDPVGRIAILNNEHWGGLAAAPDSEVVEALPAASAFALIERKELD